MRNSYFILYNSKIYKFTVEIYFIKTNILFLNYEFKVNITKDYLFVVLHAVKNLYDLHNSQNILIRLTENVSLIKMTQLIYII